MRITGTHILLRDERRDSDAEDSFRWFNLEEWNYYDEPDAPFEPVSRTQFDAWQAQPRAANPECPRAQIDTLEGQHIGWVTSYQHDRQAGSIFVGIDLPEPGCWGKGCGSEALRLWVGYLFDTFPLDAVHLKTWTGNQRMMRVALKCGFREMGRSPHRAPISVRGEPLEFAEYAISRAEWMAHSAVE